VSLGDEFPDGTPSVASFTCRSRHCSRTRPDLRPTWIRPHGECVVGGRKRRPGSGSGSGMRPVLATTAKAVATQNLEDRSGALQGTSLHDLPVFTCQPVLPFLRRTGGIPNTSRSVRNFCG
jgi:hypothetical protein